MKTEKYLVCLVVLCSAQKTREIWKCSHPGLHRYVRVYNEWTNRIDFKSTEYYNCRRRNRQQYQRCSTHRIVNLNTYNIYVQNCININFFVRLLSNCFRFTFFSLYAVRVRSMLLLMMMMMMSPRENEIRAIHAFHSCTGTPMNR